MQRACTTIAPPLYSPASVYFGMLRDELLAGGASFTTFSETCTCTGLLSHAPTWNGTSIPTGICTADLCALTVWKEQCYKRTVRPCGYIVLHMGLPSTAHQHTCHDHLPTSTQYSTSIPVIGMTLVPPLLLNKR